MAPQSLALSPLAKSFLTCFLLMHHGHNVASLLASEHQLASATGGGSDRSNEEAEHSIRPDLWMHLHGNSKEQQERVQMMKNLSLSIAEKTLIKNVEDMSEREDLKDKTEGMKASEDSKAKKVTEGNINKSRLNSAGKMDSSKSQTSGWFFEEEIEVMAVPLLTYPSKQAIKHPHSANQLSTNEEIRMALEFQVDGKNLILDLHPTRDLLAASYRDPVLGSAADSGASLECEFQGEVRGIAESWAALSVCDGIRGVIVGGAKELLVEPAPGTLTSEGPHRIVSTNHLHHSAGACGVMSSRHSSSRERTDGVLKRERRGTLHGGPLWTSKTTRYVELVLVADHSYYDTYLNKTVPRCKAIVNIVNALFRPLGVVVVLTHLEVWNIKDQIVVDEDSNKTIDNMKPYRKKLLLTRPDIPNDTTQLLTTVDFTGITIGKATMNGMCSYDDSVGIVQDKIGRISYVAQTLAHELGHNLGLGHDEDDSDCQCDTNNCIMNTSRDRHSSRISWSTCSKRNLTRTLKGFSFDCLTNVPSKLFSGSNCGNGVVEEGEQCDCGPPTYCDNPCCMAETCQLVTNATCASGSCCNTQTCTPKDMWTLCRDATAECDVPEYCTGASEYCPPDTVKEDGTLCWGAKGHCYKGVCGSHEGRCQQVWGPSALAGSPQCYTQLNQEGGPYGNCGILDLDSHTLQPCSLHDSLCGTLHCHTDADVKPKFGIVSYTAWSKDNHDCRTIFSTNDIPPSYWLSPDGAACGDGMMCVSQRCVPIPGSGLGMLFWMLLVLFLVIFCFLWDPLRWWWVKQGRAWLSRKLPCCASCLDSCCCPLMNKVTQWTATIGPFHKSKKPNDNNVKVNKEVNGGVTSQVTQNTTESWPVNHWGDDNEHRTVGVASNTRNDVHFSSNSSVLYHNSINLSHSAPSYCINTGHAYASGEVPLLDNVNSIKHWPISSASTRENISETIPTSPDVLSDDEVINKLSELTHNLNIISGKQDRSSKNENLNDTNMNVETDYDFQHETQNRQVLQPQASSDSSVKLVPVRRAPSPPVQKPKQEGMTSRSISSVSSIPLATSLTHSQIPESTVPPWSDLIIPPRPDCNELQTSDSIIYQNQEYAHQRPEPTIPPRPEYTPSQRPEPSVPPRPEYTPSQRPEPSIPPRPEYTLPQRPDPSIPSRPEPSVPPRPEFSERFVSFKKTPFVPPRP
nr:LOW QUALITY PROTEIN: uncharacterized protein LOC128692595 [Cherax quadricarinatus]